MNFSERLKLLREENNLTQNDLAEKLNISRQSVGNYEKGTRFPNDPELILKIAGLFNVSIDYLLGVTTIRHSLKNNTIKTQSRIKEEDSIYYANKTSALEKLFYEVDGLSTDNIKKITKCIKIFKDNL
ncbi:helix-turn-helix transcriptional regulator [Proteiniborus sp. MB09-C3]|uniref:helix-turn-helix domain-containing protein n=1 Tax=Proteiniborus sp. MB09-C3 TaxID=3050072 RepID=UPI002552389C|nr:helix-turn-helix transcriptional regulator [Proteiniborus sp. MB09-C3]WIV13337.1 helix-turn-helix transcriptional regulator [Proteiniborus sp. MB09-C3]